MGDTTTLYKLDFAEAEAKARTAAEFMVSAVERAVIDDIGEVYEGRQQEAALAEFKERLQPQSAFREALEARVLGVLSQRYVFLPPSK